MELTLKALWVRLTAGDGAGDNPALKQTKKKAKKEKTDGISMIMIIFMH
jgi:hypothetical protein